MRLSTTDYIPGIKYEVLGVVYTASRKLAFIDAVPECNKELISQAKLSNADMIIGIKYNQFTTPDGIIPKTIAYGTAIKFL